MTWTPLSSPSAIKTEAEISPVRKSRRKFDFPIQILQEYSHYRQDDAAKLLGVAPITLKRNCQRLRYRWPYRSIKAKLRREALFAQKLDVSNTRNVMLSSHSSSVPGLHLSVSKEKRRSPTIASDVATLMPSVHTLTAHAFLPDESVISNVHPHLPPLSSLLHKHRVQSKFHQLSWLNQPMKYESAHFATSLQSKV
ncbi:putative RWP-RK domain-containing protein [Plasmopara halstedii]